MKKISLLIFTVVLFASCSSDETETVATQNSTQEETLVRIVNVNAETIAPKEFTSFIRLIGEVKAIHDVKQSSEVSGKLVSYSVNEGQVVKAGDVFAKIDDEMLKKDVERMVAIVSSARENYMRLKELWSTDSIGSEMQ